MGSFLSGAIFLVVGMLLSFEAASVKATVFLLGTRGRNTCKAEDTEASRAQPSEGPLPVMRPGATLHLNDMCKRQNEMSNRPVRQ